MTIPPVERQQCVNGTALAAHAGHRGLADDCALLLAAKDILRGTATLNLSATTAITDWTGVTVGSSNSDGRTRVTHLNLDSMSLNGSIQAELSELSALRKLRLGGNQLTGTIPAELGRLTQLWQLDLGGNQLTGAFPTQLGAVRSLRKLYLKNNSGLTGCVPSDLRDVRFNDVAQLNLPDCAFDATETPTTPLPTFTLTITPAAGGSVDLVGAITLDEAAEVTLTASWNDATHTLAGWSGACGSTATTCTVEMYADATVSPSFTPLLSDRCSTPTADDCIRAVYIGAPNDYAQIPDVPDSVLIQPDEDGRYKLKRGQQTTVVTVAPLPAGYTRFYRQRRPVPGPSPTSHKRLIQPVGTTYTFTPTTFEGVASLISFDLTAARPRPLPRPGQKPELGNVVATTTFQIVTPPATAPTDIASSSRRGVALAPGSHRFTVYGVGTDLPSLIIDIPTSEHQIKWLTTFISNAGIKLCLSDMSEQSVLCLDRGPRKSGSAALSIPPTELPR